MIWKTADLEIAINFILAHKLCKEDSTVLYISASRAGGFDATQLCNTNIMFIYDLIFGPVTIEPYRWSLDTYIIPNCRGVDKMSIDSISRQQLISDFPKLLFRMDCGVPKQSKDSYRGKDCKALIVNMNGIQQVQEISFFKRPFYRLDDIWVFVTSDSNSLPNIPIEVIPNDFKSYKYVADFLKENK